MVRKVSTKKVAKKSVRRAGKLSPRSKGRGPASSEIAMARDVATLRPLQGSIADAGGVTLAAYRDPLGGHPLLFAALPVAAVQPTPFQRDLSPTHVRRLATKIEESGAFLDPLIVVQGEGGGLWTPNGRHRLAAAKMLGLRMITALVSADAYLAYRILALNTEKAHNLKDRALEVIRMARNLARQRPRAKENQFAAEFESAELLTLGIAYEQNSRFSGSAYSPALKKVDRFMDRTLVASLRQREGFAARLLDIDVQVKKIVAGLQARGLKSPYLKTYVAARINPVRFHKAKKGETEPPMTLAAALTRMAASARQFDLDAVNPRDLSLIAAVAGD